MKYAELKAEAFKILGNKCVKCSITNKRILQVDHIDGNGAAERKTLGRFATEKIYYRILNGYPGYQLLCANCNWDKRTEDAAKPKREYRAYVIRRALKRGAIPG